MRTSRKFVGTTEECFRDLLANHPGLSTIELVGEFCCVEREAANRTASVLRWQRGEYFPGGLDLLRLRCFLHLAGYGVSEFSRLIPEFRNLALAIVLCPLDPIKVNTDVGYSREKKGPGQLWRILLQGRGYKGSVKTEAAKLVARHKKVVDPKVAEWRERLTEFSADSTSVAPEEPAAEEVVSWEDIAAIFARNVAAATVAGRILLNSETAKEAALDATRGGLDLQELREILGQFS